MKIIDKIEYIYQKGWFDIIEYNLLHQRISDKLLNEKQIDDIILNEYNLIIRNSLNMYEYLIKSENEIDKEILKDISAITHELLNVDPECWFSILSHMKIIINTLIDKLDLSDHTLVGNIFGLSRNFSILRGIRINTNEILKYRDDMISNILYIRYKLSHKRNLNNKTKKILEIFNKLLNRSEKTKKVYITWELFKDENFITLIKNI